MQLSLARAFVSYALSRAGGDKAVQNVGVQAVGVLDATAWFTKDGATREERRVLKERVDKMVLALKDLIDQTPTTD